MENKFFFVNMDMFSMCVTPIYLLQKNSLHRFQKTSRTLVFDYSSSSHSQLQKKKLYPSRCFYERKNNNTEACFNIAKKYTIIQLATILIIKLFT